MKAFISYLTWLFFARPVKQKLRTKALQSLRLYVKAVSGARKVSMLAVLGVMGLSSITVGFFLLVGGLLWLANLNPAAYPWIMVGVGAVLAVAGIAGYIFAFRQKLWIELSQINEFTQAAIEKFPATERPTNPAVNTMWEMATDARIREHSRLENEVRSEPVVSATPATMNLNPTVETPWASESTYVRPAPRVEPSLQPS